MKLLAFTVFDSAAEAYLQPFFARSEGEAIRSFSTAASSEDHMFAKHAADYTLFKIGTFDDATGLLEVPHPPVSLGNALDYRTASAGARGSARGPQIDIEDAIREVTRG